MALEGTDISFTITNTTGERELFYWTIKPTEGSLYEYDFIDPPSKLFKSWFTGDVYLDSFLSTNSPSVSLNDGESITISLSLKDDKAVEPNHTFEIISKTDAQNAEEETIATFTIEDTIPPLITTNTSSLFSVMDSWDVSLDQSPGGEFTLDKEKDFPFAIYIPEADQGETWTSTRIAKAFYISDKNALIQYKNYDEGNNGQIFYTSKDSNGTFQKTITFDPMPEVYGYNAPLMTSFDFDANNNLFSIIKYRKKYDPENNIPGESNFKRLSSHDSEGNLLWTKKIDSSSFGLTSDNNGGLIVNSWDYNYSDIIYSRFSTNDGSQEWASQPYTKFLYGGFGASEQSIQILDDNSFLAVSSGYLNTTSDGNGGTYLAKLSLEDGSIQSLSSEIDGDNRYTSHRIFNSDGKIHLRTYDGSYEINAGANPIVENFPNFQASDITAPTPTPSPELLTNNIATLDADDISVLSTAAISSLTNEQVADLSPAAMQGFSSTQIAALPSDAVAELSIKQVKQLLAEAVQGLSPTQIAELPAKTIKGFSPEQIEQLHKRTFKALDTNQLAKFSNDAITGLTTAQLKTLSRKELSVFKRRQLKAIDPDAISGLKPKSLNGLRRRQARAFTDDQLAALKKNQIKKADVFIDNLSTKQSDALSFDTSRSNRLVDLTDELNALALNSSLEILA